MSSFIIKQGDLRPDLQVTLFDENGAAEDLTGETVKFRWQRKDKVGAAKIADATVVDALKGIVKYVWVAGDTDIAGLYRAEWVMLEAGKTKTYPASGYQEFLIEAYLE